MIDPREKARAAFVSEVSVVELAVRLIEAGDEMKRPPGMTAERALSGLSAEDYACWTRMATAAITYMGECFSNARKPS